jgi:hypothetical protein
MLRDNSYLIGNQFAKGNKPNRASFKKGNVPWTKGRKGVHHSPATEFKKGQIANNKLPIGSITKRLEKRKTIRQFIKIAEPNIWIEYAKFVWIQYYGKIPKGFLIHHIDRNPLNDNIENFALVTRSGHINIHRDQLLEAKNKIYIETGIYPNGKSFRQNTSR